LGKYVFAGGAGLATVLFVRFTIAALFFWIITIMREGFPRLTLKIWLILWGMGGICYSLMAGLYLSSVQYIPASLAALLLYAFPIIVTVFAVVTHQETFSRFKFLGLLLSTTGLVLLLALGVVLDDINTHGVALALGSACVYATYIIIGNQVLQTTTPLVTITLISTSAALTYGIVGFTMSGMTWNVTLTTWLGMGGIALFSTIIAMLTFFYGMKLIGAPSASIISTLEPLLTVIFAVILFGEHITLLQAIGGILVVIGAIVTTLSPPLSVMQEINPFKKVGRE